MSLWGWYRRDLTADALAAACDPARIDAHYVVQPGGRLRWTQDGVASCTSPTDTAALVELVQSIIKIYQQVPEAFRVQVRREDWPQAK